MKLIFLVCCLFVVFRFVLFVLSSGRWSVAVSLFDKSCSRSVLSSIDVDVCLVKDESLKLKIDDVFGYLLNYVDDPDQHKDKKSKKTQSKTTTTTPPPLIIQATFDNVSCRLFVYDDETKSDFSLEMSESIVVDVKVFVGDEMLNVSNLECAESDGVIQPVRLIALKVVVFFVFFFFNLCCK